MPSFPGSPVICECSWKKTQIEKKKQTKIPSFFLVCIFSHSDWILRDAEYISVFSPNTGKYGPEKTSYLDTFHAVQLKKTSKLF